MTAKEYSPLHRRARGLSRVITAKVETYQRDLISNVPLGDLKYIVLRLESMLRDDEAACQRAGYGEMPCKNSDQYLNTQCEFFDISSSRIQCAIGCDMYHCSRNCCYATNMPNATPPYCTKYMNGRL